MTLNEQEKTEERELLKNKYSWALELNNYNNSAFASSITNYRKAQLQRTLNQDLENKFNEHSKNVNYFNDKLQAAVKSAVKDFAHKPYRKPLENSELQEWMELLIRSTKKAKNLQATIQSLIVSMVLHPSFIYRFEEDNSAKVNSYDLGYTTLYFLWSSTLTLNFYNLLQKR